MADSPISHQVERVQKARQALADELFARIPTISSEKAGRLAEEIETLIDAKFAELFERVKK